MKRREFLKSLALVVLGSSLAPEVFAQSLESSSISLTDKLNDHIKDYLHKMKNFNMTHSRDVQIDRVQYSTFKSTVLRLRRLQQYAGHGNFQILSFDGGLNMARRSAEVGEFTKKELNFMEMLFYKEASNYGFLGQKPIKKLTERVNKKNVLKIPYSGNYLYRGRPVETFTEIRKLIGDKAIMTSGVRSVMKQFLLFLNKAYKYSGNLSLASRSLAPPGYSYHGIGDFDVGQAGLGLFNFTDRFTNTEVYKRLAEHGYLKLRYPENNMIGVRYEPWHIEIKS